MVMWERPAGPAGGNGGCAGRVMYDGRHEGMSIIDGLDLMTYHCH